MCSRAMKISFLISSRRSIVGAWVSLVPGNQRKLGKPAKSRYACMVSTYTSGQRIQARRANQREMVP